MVIYASLSMVMLICTWWSPFAHGLEHVNLYMVMSSCTCSCGFAHGHVHLHINMPISTWSCPFAHCSFFLPGMNLPICTWSYPYAHGHFDFCMMNVHLHMLTRICPWSCQVRIFAWPCRFLHDHYDAHLHMVVPISTCSCGFAHGWPCAITHECAKSGMNVRKCAWTYFNEH